MKHLNFVNTSNFVTQSCRSNPAIERDSWPKGFAWSCNALSQRLTCPLAPCGILTVTITVVSKEFAVTSLKSYNPSAELAATLEDKRQLAVTKQDVPQLSLLSSTAAWTVEEHSTLY